MLGDRDRHTPLPLPQAVDAWQAGWDAGRVFWVSRLGEGASPDASDAAHLPVFDVTSPSAADWVALLVEDPKGGYWAFDQRAVAACLRWAKEQQWLSGENMPYWMRWYGRGTLRLELVEEVERGVVASDGRHWWRFHPGILGPYLVADPGGPWEAVPDLSVAESMDRVRGRRVALGRWVEGKIRPVVESEGWFPLLGQ